MVAGTAVLLMVCAWVFTAEARGPLPAGDFAAAVVPVWPASPGGAQAIRDDALARAAVRVSAPEAVYLADVPDPLAGIASDPLICRYLHDEPSGTSAKFNCVLDGGAVVKVKYSRNPEIHAEVAATRLLTALGFPADGMAIVPRLRCYGCPRFPFVVMQLLSLARANAALAPHGYERAYTDFEWVAVERRFPAPAIETPALEGWAWFELAHSEAPRADLDALRLMAMFIAHWDNKSENQRLVCLDDIPAEPDRPCTRPLALIQDLGATFGPSKVSLSAWRDMPVWRDSRRCEISMSAFPFEGATFTPVRISEAGRQQLARQLASMSEADVRRLFADARFPEFLAATNDQRDLDEWAGAFRHRLDQILTAGPCLG
jgi:hypothetical protein